MLHIKTHGSEFCGQATRLHTTDSLFTHIFLLTCRSKGISAICHWINTCCWNIAVNFDNEGKVAIAASTCG